MGYKHYANIPISISKSNDKKNNIDIKTIPKLNKFEK